MTTCICKGEMLPTAPPEDVAYGLFEAPFVVVSHGMESDPIFNYGNRKALELWELSWDDFIQMPSRKSAEEVVWKDRERFLAEATNQGFSRNYSGIRISSTLKRFYVEDLVLWNIFDENKQQCGQAAFYLNWKYL
jgi:MEKHLA domain